MAVRYSVAMGAGQRFRGVLGFDTPDAAVSAVREAARSAGEDASVVESVRRTDCVLVVDLSTYGPSSSWHPLVGAFSGLAERAICGHVTMHYEGERGEYCWGTPVPSKYALSAPQPSRWLPLADDIERFERTRRGETYDARFEVMSCAHGVRALDVGDSLGLLMHLVPDGERLFAMAETWARDELPDVSVARRGLHCVAEMDRVGSTHLFAYPRKEIATVFCVVGPDEVRLRGRTVTNALAIDVDVLEIPFEGEAMREPFAPKTRLRLWLEQGRGLVAIRDRP